MDDFSKVLENGLGAAHWLAGTGVEDETPSLLPLHHVEDVMVLRVHVQGGHEVVMVGGAVHWCLHCDEV